MSVASRFCFHTVAAAILLSDCSAMRAAESLPADAREFLAKHCLDCHSGDESKAEVDLSVQAIDWTAAESTGFWERVYNTVSHNEMPPFDAVQPTRAERAQMVEWLEGRLVEHAKPGGTVLRRLNREEYENTIRDLFDLSEFVVPDAFPADDSGYGFDNIGDALILSPPLLAQYLELATSIADQVLPPDTGPLVAKSRRYDIGGKGLAPLSANSIEGDRFRITSSKSNAATAGWPARFEASESGIYRITVAATTLQTDQMFYERIEVPFRMGVYAKPKTEQTYSPFEELRKLTEFGVDSKRDEPQSFTAEIELNKGEAFGLRWENGPFDSNSKYSERIANDRRAYAAMLQLGRDPRGMSPADYYDKIFALMNSEKLDLKNPWLDRPTGSVGGFLGGGRPPKGRPQIRVNWYLQEEMRRFGPALDVTDVSIEGPLRLIEDEKTRTQKARTARFLGRREENSTDRQFTEAVLRRFLPRAFRRSVSDEQVRAYADLVMREIDSAASGSRVEDGVHLAIRRALSSPNFLYRSVRPGKLDGFDLASRLSYFLTSAPPDDQLFDLASRGELSDSGVLRRETLRLIDSPRNTNFVRSFTGQWLATRTLSDIMPDPRLYFYHQSHQTAMTNEAEMLFTEILQENHSLETFIDPGFSYRNRWTNDFYGDKLPDKEMQRVEFARGGRHGGIIGLAAVMMATANGVDTHPVQRGVWLLENVFDTPTPEPPDNVPAISTDSSGATTMREKLEAHRADESCARCHDMIDPLGVVLENFDPIGRWREHYPIYVETKGEKLKSQFYSNTGKGTVPGPQIDSAATLKDGTRFEDVTDMKRYLVDNIKIFSRCLAGKLLVYATGRPMSFGDRRVISKVVDNVQSHGNGFRDLIVEIILSEAFQSK